jgi:hypothetical protein
MLGIIIIIKKVCEYSKEKHEVLERTNRLLSLIRHGQHWKRRVQQVSYCWVIFTEPLPSNGKLTFTERLPSNDKGTFTEQLPSNNRGIFTEPLPTKDKGTFTEPLPSNDMGIHTHGQQRDLISRFYF